jgi:hypothetical protein
VKGAGAHTLENLRKVLVTAPSHAACDAFTLALGRQWPPTQPACFVRLADGLRLTDPRVGRYLPEHYKVTVATGQNFVTVRSVQRKRGGKQIFSGDFRNFLRESSNVRHCA